MHKYQMHLIFKTEYDTSAGIVSDFWGRSVRTKSLNNFEIWCVTTIKTSDCLYLDLMPLVTWILAAVDLNRSLHQHAHTRLRPPWYLRPAEGRTGYQSRETSQALSQLILLFLGIDQQVLGERTSPFPKYKHAGFHSTTLSKPLSTSLQACRGKDCFRGIPWLKHRGFFQTNCSHLQEFLLPLPMSSTLLISQQLINGTSSPCRAYVSPGDLSSRITLKYQYEYLARRLPFHLPTSLTLFMTCHCKHRQWGEGQVIPSLQLPHSYPYTAELTRCQLSWVPAEKRGSARCFAAQLVMLEQQLLPKETNNNRWNRQRQCSQGHPTRISCYTEP